MTGATVRLLRRELRLSLRQGSGALLAVPFFLVAVTLFPLGLGPKAEFLGRAAPGAIWIAALLAAALSFGRMFRQDFEDGALEHLVLSPLPLEAVVLAKAAAAWLLTGLPLALCAPFLALILHLPESALLALAAGLLLGTPVLSLIGAVGGALVLGARQAGVLVTLLILPLCIPILIFGVGAAEAAAVGQAVRPHLLLLAAGLLAALALAPWAAAAALRQAVA